jgi:S-DNA-T family DNA segregation ATPase FtsK/SpoIIIE
MGQYGLYAYAADDLFSVRKKFESYISDTPVSTVPPQRMVEILTHKAKESGNAVLMSATAGVQAELAALVALNIAREGGKEGDFDFVLSLDDFGWTGAWLRDGIRADYLIVRVSLSGAVHLCVLESKSERPGPRIVCEQSHKAFSEGISQVQKTLDVLAEIFFAEEPTLDQDLRFSTLIEQLMAVALAEHIADRASRLKLFKVINDLSARRLRPMLDGLVVLTQAGVTESRLEKSITKSIRIVAAGRSEVERTFGVGDSYQTPPAANQNVEGDPLLPDQISTKRATNKGKRATEQQGVSDLDEVLATPGQSTPAELAPEVPSVQVQNHSPSSDKASHERPSIPDEYVQLARRLISVAALQKVEVDGAEPVFTLDGPSLITIGVRLKEGASLQPFRARLGDIARDIGMGDKADFIQVENDSMPRTVRVIIPRPEKNIPPVPQERMDPLSDDGYLPIYMGQTVDGRDYKTTVESWPHMLVAGSTGTGKTTLLKTLLTQLGRYAGDHLQCLIADGKGETDYMNLIPEYGFVPEFPDVQLGAESALQVLQWAVEEMERRREYIVNLARKSSTTQQGISAISLFKEAVSKGAEPPIRPLIIVVDEFADIIISSKKNADMFENLIQRISQVGRSRMMHLLLATQRPDKETIRGAIKANLNARVVLQLPTQADSMTVLGQSGAEKLLKPGDFLFQRGSGSLVRLQGYRF